MLSDALGQLLDDQCSPQVVREIEAGGSPRKLWDALAESGFADALVPEAEGGAGLRLADLFAVIELCGGHALPLPLAETMWARAVLAEAGLERPEGSIALAAGTVAATGAVRCDTVRLGRTADWVLAAVADGWRLLPVSEAEAEPAGFVLDAGLRWDVPGVARGVALAKPYELRTVQACLVAPQLAGAMLWVFQRTLQYANDRVQFGRPIGKFQAIQHQLSVMSEQVFAARMAAQIGCQCEGLAPDRLRVAVAKARASEAALAVAELGHSIHGAIGFTAEFDLQLFTRRLHLWRQTAGAESYWQGVAGSQLVDRHRGPTLDLIRSTTDTA